MNGRTFSPNPGKARKSHHMITCVCALVFSVICHLACTQAVAFHLQGLGSQSNLQLVQEYDAACDCFLIESLVYVVYSAEGNYRLNSCIKHYEQTNTMLISLGIKLQKALFLD